MISSLFAAVLLFPPNTPPGVTVEFPKTVHANQVFRAVLKLRFAEGLHGYQNPPSDPYEIPVKVSVASGAKLIGITYPAGVPMQMSGQPAAKVYSGTISIPVRLKAPAKSGPVIFSVDYQQCTDASCFPPAKVKEKVSLTVKP